MKKILLVVDNEDSKWVKSLSTYPKDSEFQLLTFNVSDQYLIQKYSHLIRSYGLKITCLNTFSETEIIEKSKRFLCQINFGFTKIQIKEKIFLFMIY